jgi:uncharacterized protein (TIGR02145 family)
VIKDQSFAIPETTSVGTVIATIAAYDAEGSALTWNVLSASDKSAFSLGRSDGILTLSAALDYETTRSYTLKIQVRDAGIPIKADTATVTITVTDKNEPPQAKNDTLYVTQGSFSRYIQNGIPLCSLSVSDKDAADASKIFEYTLIDGNAGGYFSLDEAQGIVSPTLTPGTGDYPLQVKVTDAGRLSDTAMILFHIISDTFLDSRNNQTYKRVSIGRQVWMGENLNFKTDSSWCYNNTESYCDTYGRLYQWHAAMAIDAIYDFTLWGGSDVNHQGVCPDGWHLPSNGEWKILVGYVDANNGSEIYWKSLNATSGWYNGGTSSTHNGNGSDKFGFSMLPAGYRQGTTYNGVSCYTAGNFCDAGESVGLWFTTEDASSNRADAWGLSYNNGYFTSASDDAEKLGGSSIRCIQNTK